MQAKSGSAPLQQHRRLSCTARARVAVRAAAAPAAPPAPPRQAKAPALYLLQWHRQAAAPQDDGIIKQLKALEKVSKDAVWFSVKESEDGGAQHVLVVTDNAKAAKKYQLQEIPQQDAPLAVVLEGLPAPVEVPVPAIRAALLQRMMDEDSDSSDSDEEDCPTTSMTKKGKATATAELPQTVEENPLAAQQAAALLAAAPGPGGEGGAAAEVVLGLVAKEQRRKLKDAVRDVEKGVHGDGQPAALPMAMGEEGDSSTSSSSSSSSSESDEEEEMPTTKMGKKKEDKEKEDKKKDKKKDKELAKA